MIIFYPLNIFLIVHKFEKTWNLKTNA